MTADMDAKWLAVNLLPYMTIALGHDPRLARELAFALGHIFSSNLARDLRRDLEAGLKDSQAVSRYLSRALSQSLSNVPNQPIRRNLTPQDAIGLTAAIGEVARQHFHTPNRHFGADMATVADGWFKSAFNIVRGTARDDVSKEDLSLLDIFRLDLTGLVWSDETVWPPGAVDSIREQSEVLRPGKYRVVRWNRRLPMRDSSSVR